MKELQPFVMSCEVKLYLSVICIALLLTELLLMALVDSTAAFEQRLTEVITDVAARTAILAGGMLGFCLQIPLFL